MSEMKVVFFFFFLTFLDLGVCSENKNIGEPRRLNKCRAREKIEIDMSIGTINVATGY